MTRTSLLRQGRYSLEWVKDFYTQAGEWWGPEMDRDYHAERLATIGRLGGPPPRRILDLGAGFGGTAIRLADQGYTVTAVELSSTIRHAQARANLPRKGSLNALEADFYTVALEGRYDMVCCWQCFGIGSDADQRRLLRRIAQEGLAPGSCALIDVYNPFLPASLAGTEERLPPLEGVPGSVEMIERCHFDPVRCRWIDEWQPTAAPENALAQTVRCYTPADLRLLLEGSGLALKRIEVDGQELNFESDRIGASGPLMKTWAYLAQLVLHGT